MKEVSEDLYQLAQSITPAEAGYFVTYLKRFKLSHTAAYLAVFTLMRQQHTYNENELKAAAQSAEVVKKFSFHKSVILDYLLASLISYYRDSSVETTLHRLLESAAILSQKHLHRAALKMINKAEQLALQYEKHAILLEIYEYERRLLKQTSTQNIEQAFEENRTKRAACIQKLENAGCYAAINDKVFILYRELNVAKTPDNQNKLGQLMKSPLLKNEKQALSFDARLKYFEIHALSHQLKAEYKKAATCREHMFTLWENHPHMIPEMPVRYRTDLSSLLSLRSAVGNWTDFEPLLQRLQKLRGATSEETAATFREVLYLRQIYYLNNNKLKEALALLPEIEKGLEQYESLIGTARLFNFYFNNCITCFLCGKYDAALHWSQHLAKPGKHKNIRNDLREFARILELIIYYQTGKHDIAQQHLRNTRDRLNYSNTLFEFEQIVLQHIKALLILTKDRKQEQKQLTLFSKELEQLNSRTADSKLLGLEEIIFWLKQKI